ncbi:MAG: hypothetical protein ABEJ08_02850 [Halobacteriaceae archaeon]
MVAASFTYGLAVVFFLFVVVVGVGLPWATLRDDEHTPSVESEDDGE